jgi:hypothetical protein
MACRELIRNPGFGVHFEPERFRRLHRTGRRLIGHWFQRAWRRRNCDPADSFEPFIFCWIALNGWAACCTEIDQDRQWLDSLSDNAEVCGHFEGILASTKIRAVAETFREFWPIFRVQGLRRLGIVEYGQVDRSETIARYLQSGAKEFSPECWRRHSEAHEEVPLDFPHTAAALYRVRCNLFHGDKAPHSEVDRTLVYNGFRLLAEFLQSWDLLRYLDY